MMDWVEERGEKRRKENNKGGKIYNYRIVKIE
jgi:hypothetical protein